MLSCYSSTEDIIIALKAEFLLINFNLKAIQLLEVSSSLKREVSSKIEFKNDF